MTETTFPSKTRYIVLAVSLAIVAGVFYMGPQITSIDPQIAAVQTADRELRRKNYQEAAEILIDATNQYPRNADIRYRLGLAYEGLGQRTTALNQYVSALTLDPYQVGAVYALGLAYAQEASWPLAKDMLARLQTSCASGNGCTERDFLAAAIAKGQAQEDEKK